jgi:WD40 repeat protein
VDGAIEWRDVVSRWCRQRLPGQGLAGHAFTFTLDANTVAVGNDDGSIRLWDTATGQDRTTLAGHSKAVTALAFSADSCWLAAGSHDQTIILWQLPRSDITQGR